MLFLLQPTSAAGMQGWSDTGSVERIPLQTCCRRSMTSGALIPSADLLPLPRTGALIPSADLLPLPRTGSASVGTSCFLSLYCRQNPDAVDEFTPSSLSFCIPFLSVVPGNTLLYLQPCVVPCPGHAHLGNGTTPRCCFRPEFSRPVAQRFSLLHCSQRMCCCIC